MKIVLTKEQAIQHLKSRFEYMFGTGLSGENIEVEIVDLPEETKPETECWIENTSTDRRPPEHLKGKLVRCILRDDPDIIKDFADNLDWAVKGIAGDIIKYMVIS